MLLYKLESDHFQNPPKLVSLNGKITSFSPRSMISMAVFHIFPLSHPQLGSELPKVHRQDQPWTLALRLLCWMGQVGDDEDDGRFIEPD